MANQLKLYRQVLLSKQVIGASERQLTFSTGEWWKLACPAANWLDFIGCWVTGLRIVGDNMELTLDYTHKAFLHWRVEGKITGPVFPIPGRPRCWEWGIEDAEWAGVDAAFDEIDRESDCSN